MYYKPRYCKWLFPWRWFWNSKWRPIPWWFSWVRYRVEYESTYHKLNLCYCYAFVTMLTAVLNSGNVTSVAFSIIFKQVSEGRGILESIVKGYMSLVRHTTGSTHHWSDTPLVRHTIGPTHHWSDTPLVRHTIGPTHYWSDTPLVRHTIGSMVSL